jgi:predicted transposase YdaD
MAGAFDGTMKQLLDACAVDWVAWLAPLVGLPANVSAEPLDVELSTVQPVADKVFQLGAPASGLLHLEPQSAHDLTFPDRLLLYNVLLEHRYGGPVHTVALLLRRAAQAPALTGALARTDATGAEYLRFRYTVVRVWELKADELLAGGLGATPLALLTDDAEPRLQEVAKRFAARVTAEANTTDANLLLSCAFILSGMRYDKAVGQALFAGVQKMRESTTYMAILEEGHAEGLAEGLTTGRAEGRAEGEQRSLLALIRARFGAVPPAVEAKVRATTDTAILEAAVARALAVATPELVLP